MRKLVLFAILLAVALPVIFPVPGHAWTRGDIITEVRAMMGDENTDSSIRVWSDTVLHSRIDQAEEDINKQTRCMVSRSTIATTCGTQEYEIPSGVMLVSRVSYDTDGSSTTRKYKELTYATMDLLDRDYAGWDNETSSGTPSLYYYRGKYIGLYPAPGLKYSGDYGDIRINYIIQPTTSTSDSTVIFEGYKTLQTYKNTIIDYVCAMCAKDEDDGNMMNFFWNKYTADIANMQERINNKPDRVGGITR